MFSSEQTEDPIDLRLLLQRELIKRCKERPGYSLRSFSKTLDMDSTALSRILAGKRKVTAATRQKLFEKLNLSPAQIEQFSFNQIEKKPHTKQKYATVYNQIAHDTFQAMSHWYYMAILELPYLKDFNPSHKWMAKALGITVSEVKIALDTLQRLDLIEITEGGEWVDKKQFFSAIQPNVTSASLRANQKQVLTKAVEALDNTPIEKRDQTSLTFAMDLSRLNLAKEHIKNFRRGLCDLLQEGKENDAVYTLTISLFPLTNIA